MLDALMLKPITQKLTLLYVEDDPEIMAQLKMLFKKLFKCVYTAENGQEGIERYGQHAEEIDLIITDIKMPVMNGLEMVRALHASSPALHTIFMTAHSDLEFFAQAIEVGVDSFIVKPVQTHQLFGALYKVSRAILAERELNSYHESIERELIKKTRELEDLYAHDSLTGCYSREKLRKDLLACSHSCIMLINLDSFDAINSTYGYRIGDEVLRKFVLFLQERFGEPYRIYRPAGDEFVILVPHELSEHAPILSGEINQAIQSHVFEIQECQIHLTCTIGIARNECQNASCDCEELLIKAHAAMKEVREIGKNRFHIYTPASSYLENQKNNIRWMHKVRQALKDDTIIPYYQPIIDNATQKPVKYECLSRMKDAFKVITPNYYIEPARLVGLLPRVTEVMMTKAYSYFSTKACDFTLNITEDDLKANFIPSLLDQLGTLYGIDPSRVTLEILENISAQGSDEVLSQLLELKAMGFLLALDDFGSDKSNFYRLQKMDVDILKIDGGFIKDITTNKNNEKIVKTIVQFAESLECTVVAEFVHSQEVFEKIKSLGIGFSQGYWFGEPKPTID